MGLGLHVGVVPSVYVKYHVYFPCMCHTYFTTYSLLLWLKGKSEHKGVKELRVEYFVLGLSAVSHNLFV